MNNLNPRFDHAVGDSRDWPTRRRALAHTPPSTAAWQFSGEKIELGDGVAGVVLQVMDRDAYTSDDPIGAVFLSSEYLAHKTARGEHTYFLSHGTQTQGQITVELEFHPEGGGGGAAAAYDEAGHPDDLFNKVMRTLGAQYTIVGEWAAGQAMDADCSPGPGLCDAYGQMKLIVLARKNIVPHISGFRCKNKNTGYAGLRNKGGLVAAFDYRGSSIAFVCSHLAAHEGIKHCRERNEMARAIMGDARPGGGYQEKLDLGSQYDHIVWAGDLNYRQEMPGWWRDPDDRLLGRPADVALRPESVQVRSVIMSRSPASRGQYRSAGEGEARGALCCMAGWVRAVCELDASALPPQPDVQCDSRLR
jgi:hypothetical protein